MVLLIQLLKIMWKIFKLKMKNSIIHIILFSCFLILVSCFLILASGCKKTENHPGFAYMDHMVHSPAYKYYGENPNFKDGKTAQYPVIGTLARGEELPFPYLKTIDDQKRAGKELINPISYSPEDIKIGKEKFITYCSMCHGVDGKGDGIIAKNKKFDKPVTLLVSDYVQKKPDGELFHTITLGSVSGFMGSHSA